MTEKIIYELRIKNLLETIEELIKRLKN